jgi:PAS domain S-box-containing protein
MRTRWPSPPGASLDVRSFKPGECVSRNNRQYWDLLESAPDGYVITDAAGRILQANRAVGTMLAADLAALAGTPLDTFLETDDHLAFPERLRGIVKAGRLDGWEGRLRPRDGTPVHVAFSCALEPPQDGRPASILWTLRDITGRKKAAKALREARDQLELRVQERTAELHVAAHYARHLIEVSLDPLVTISPEGKITDVNAATELVTGIPRDRLIGTHFSDYATEPDRANAGYQQVIAHGHVRDFPLTIRHVSGKTTDVLYNATLYRNAAGEVQGVFAAARDVTERKRAEEALRTERKRLYDVLETLPVILALFRPDHRVVWVNQAYREALGDNVGQLCYASQFERDQPCAECQAFIPLQTHKPHFWQWALPNGRTFDIYNFPFTDADGSPMILEMDIDITDRKNAEAELEKHRHHLEELVSQRTSQLEAAKTAAERANAAKDHFLAALSHELRTPLTPALMISQLHSADERLPEEVRMDMETIRQNITLEARLIDDLLDLTRIARGKILLKIERVDVHALLREALRACSDDYFLNKRLRISCDLAAPESWIFGDPVRLEQVFWNLFKNAIKFTPESGEITIRTENGADCIRVRVSDTGVGIEPDKLRSIFDAFEQGGADRTRQFGGLGLGLAICKGIVDLHAGRIEAASAGVSRGTTMTVELPLAVEPLPPAPPAGSGDLRLPHPAIPTSHKRILLVEDHGPTAFIMRRLLVKWGYQVELATCIRTAREMAAGSAFDLVISDLGLPDGHGHELMAHLHQQYGLRGIALSGYGSGGDVEKSLASGFVEHLTKPVDFELLRSTIATVLG